MFLLLLSPSYNNVMPMSSVRQSLPKGTPGPGQGGRGQGVKGKMSKWEKARGQVCGVGQNVGAWGLQPGCLTTQGKCRGAAASTS